MNGLPPLPGLRFVQIAVGQIAVGQKDVKVSGPHGYHYSVTPVLFGLDAAGKVWRLDGGAWNELTDTKRDENATT